MAVDSYQLAVIGYQFIERQCEEAMADVAICAITVLGLLLMEAVSSSGDIGVETKITAYREPLEVETTKHFSIHPDSRRATRSDEVLDTSRLASGHSK